MKYNGYRKQLMSEEADNANTIVYDTGYDQGQKDIFPAMVVIGVVCGVLGWIIGMVM